MAKVFVTRNIPMWEEVSKPLKDAGHEVVVKEINRPITREELVEEVEKGYDGLITLLTEKIDEELLSHDKMKKLKVVANYAVGFDNIDVPVCNKWNIKVSNTPCDEVNESVAEFTWTLILCLARRIGEAGEFMRNAAYKGWEPDIFIGTDLRGKVLGIVGMGRIGGMIAKRESGFGMKVLYYNRKRVDEQLEKEMGVEYRENLNDLLKEADFVSLNVPLSAETRHLINGKNLPLFKKGAMLINTARGPVVDEVEVAEALRAGMLGGYAADVFENEPDPYAELLQMENVILTPHIASATVGARRKMGELAVLNMIEGLAGRDLPNAVKA
jgi:glyoxylate reductase